MIIAQISDTHIDPENANNEARLRQLEACVADINSLDPSPDLVIHTGDMAHNGDEEKYGLAGRILEKLNAPLRVCAGNRDDRVLLRERFTTGRDLMPGTSFLHYAVDDFAVRLIIVDTISDTGNQGAYCRNRADALAGALRDKPDTPTVLFMHHPPFEVTESKFPQQFNPWDGAELVASTLDGCTQVIGAFCGHAHRDARGTVAGIPFASVPSTAVDLRLGDYGDENDGVPLYRIIRLDGGSGVSSELRAVQSIKPDTAADAAAD